MLAMLNFKLWLREQRLRLHSGKYEAYLNQIRQDGLERNPVARMEIAGNLLKEPDFSRMRAWAEYQRLKNAAQNPSRQIGDGSNVPPDQIRQTDQPPKPQPVPK